MAGAFECNVSWDNGNNDTVYLTDLEFDLDLFVAYRADTNWVGQITNIYDWNDVGIQNICVVGAIRCDSQDRILWISCGQ